MAAVATVKIDLLTLINTNWVSWFSNGILSEIPVCDATPCYTAFLCNIDGFYCRGVIIMALRGGLVNVGHQRRPRCEMHGPPLPCIHFL